MCIYSQYGNRLIPAGSLSYVEFFATRSLVTVSRLLYAVATELVLGGFLHCRWDEKRLSDGGSLSMCISVFMNIAFPFPALTPPPPAHSPACLLATHSLLLLWLGSRWDVGQKYESFKYRAIWGGLHLITDATVDLRFPSEFIAFYLLIFLHFQWKVNS